MTAFSFIMLFGIILGGSIGYRFASNDLLQQVFLARKFGYRLSEFLCVAVSLTVLWLRSAPLLRIIPPIVCVLYILSCRALALVLRRKGSQQCKEDIRYELRETALCTTISVSISIGMILLVCLFLARSPLTVDQLEISMAEQYVCHALVLSVGALLLSALGHYLLTLRLYPSDSDSPGRALVQLRKKLHALPRL